MASETIYGYFGQKGAGKTHELVRVILARLREGRRVVAVMPQLDVDKVARYLGDPTVKDRLIVADYTDVTDNPKFFPDEHVVRKLQLWKRFAIDYSMEEPKEDSPRSPMPDGSANWRDSVVWPGDLVVIDEAWRWLESAKDIPKPLKSALHMARHWHGPADWRGDENVSRYTSADWFPGYGGPEWADEFEDQPLLDKLGQPVIDVFGKPKTHKVKVRKFKGGDGTPMVTTNILFASQDFFGLARSLRGQIDQTTLLISIRDSYFPTLLKKATDGQEQYMAYTFEAADMPTRRQMLAALEKGEKLWLTEETITHEGPIHSLYEYASGYAQEKRADNKSDLSNNPHWKKIKRGGILLLTLFGGAILLGLFAWSKLGSQSDLVANTSKGSVKTSVSGGGKDAAAPRAAPGTYTRAEDVDRPPAFEGRVGKFLSFHSPGKTTFALVEDAVPLSTGWRVELDGRTIETASAMAAGDPDPRSDGGSGTSTVDRSRSAVGESTSSLSEKAKAETRNVSVGS